ncbi:MAG: hypothetical protein PHE47_05670 [Oscillospiraceae bacterium]|nr:hypothetical protein [Oscillospiraceae bacterium]
METIQLETLLELISADVWLEEQKLKKRNVRPTLRVPTFAERAGVVGDMLQRAAVDGRTIRFDAQGSAPVDVPAYNYFLASNELIMSDFIDGVSQPQAASWEIHGFDLFEELSEYLNQAEFMCGFSVYVKHRYQYEKAFCRYAFQRPNEEKTYTDVWGFYYPNEALADEWQRDQSYRYFFEIVGLCEFHTGQEVFCALLNSFDDLYRELEGRLCDIGIDGDDAWEEHGAIRFDGADYTYRIWGDGKGASYELRNAEGEQYCYPRHCFSDFSCDGIEDCTLCPCQ